MARVRKEFFTTGKRDVEIHAQKAYGARKVVKKRSYRGGTMEEVLLGATCKNLVGERGRGEKVFLDFGSSRWGERVSLGPGQPFPAASGIKERKVTIGLDWGGGERGARNEQNEK